MPKGRSTATCPDPGSAAACGSRRSDGRFEESPATGRLLPILAATAAVGQSLHADLARAGRSLPFAAASTPHALVLAPCVRHNGPHRFMVYLDNAASTPMVPAVQQALLNAMQTHFGNPSSAHGLGAAAARELEAARAQVAKLLGGLPQEIVFTSGGTESNALAVLGAARARARKRHVVVTAIEHPSVLRNCQRLAAEGFQVSVVPPERDGIVSAQRLLQEVTSQTAVVAMMLINSELGTQQPVEAVAQALSQWPQPPHLHVDAVQAAAWLPISVKALGASSLSLSGHKLHGPKGTGALWVRKDARLLPLWEGGGQENGLRSGTENLPALVAFAQACSLSLADQKDAAIKIRALRDDFERRVCATLSGVNLTVEPQASRAPHISSLRFSKLPAEPLLHALEARGVMVSAGSACASKKTQRSHVLQAIGVAEGDGVLRFSFSRFTTPADVDTALVALGEAVDEIASLTTAAAFKSRR